MTVRRCEFYLRMLQYLSRVSEANQSLILATRKDEVRISNRSCNVLFIILKSINISACSGHGRIGNVK
jgi:hypothetical protein